MRIPGSVDIGGVTYTVSFEDEIRGNRVGEIDFHGARIFISTTTNQDVQSWTFCHELVHGILMALGYGEGDEIVLDEKFIDSFGAHLHIILKQLYPKE